MHPDLIPADRQRFYKKLQSFIAAGADKIHVVFDFDRTLTVRNPKTNQDITTWHILGQHLPKEGHQEYAELFAKYRPLEMSESLTEELAAQWWETSLNLLVKYKVNINNVEQDFVERASIRPGAVELFRLCNELDVPTVILSAGVRDVIDVWGRAYAVQPSLVLSTALKVDESGVVVGWHQDTLIHVLNKHETDHSELTNIRSRRPKAIVIGDSISDADMAKGKDDVLRIRIFDPRKDEVADVEQMRQRTFQRFDAIIECGSFDPIIELVRAIG